MHDDEYTRELAAISDRLNRLSADANSEIGYDIFADALIWSDEYPQDMDSQVRDYQCLRIVLRYRTTKVLGETDDALKVYWDTAQELFPSWPGFSIERCTASPELQQQFHRLKNNQDRLLGCDQPNNP